MEFRQHSIIIITNSLLFTSHYSDRISQEWHQKIENWLQSNDYDEKFNEEYKRKRRLANINRRPLENESG